MYARSWNGISSAGNEETQWAYSVYSFSDSLPLVIYTPLTAWSDQRPHGIDPRDSLGRIGDDFHCKG